MSARDRVPKFTDFWTAVEDRFLMDLCGVVDTPAVRTLFQDYRRKHPGRLRQRALVGAMVAPERVPTTARLLRELFPDATSPAPALKKKKN